MLNITSRGIVESIAVLGVILSMLFVGLEFRQNAIASRAAAYQELGIATSELIFTLSDNRELAVLVERVTTDFQNFSEEDRIVVTQWTRGSLRVYETIFLQVKLGLLEPEALDYLGWEWFRQGDFLKQMWPIVRVGLPSDFATFIENSWNEEIGPGYVF